MDWFGYVRLGKVWFGVPRQRRFNVRCRDARRCVSNMVSNVVPRPKCANMVSCGSVSKNGVETIGVSFLTSYPMSSFGPSAPKMLSCVNVATVVIATLVFGFRTIFH
jgi:hypothetical protein